MQKCQSQIGIKTGTVEKLCLPDCRGDSRKIEKAIEEFVQDLESGGVQRSSCFAIVLLDRRDHYSRIKSVLTRLGLLSQAVTKQTAGRMNLSVASNIMKQINSKVGGESLRVKFPQFMDTEKVMVIGIDVCHAG